MTGVQTCALPIYPVFSAAASSGANVPEKRRLVPRLVFSPRLSHPSSPPSSNWPRKAANFDKGGCDESGLGTSSSWRMLQKWRLENLSSTLSKTGEKHPIRDKVFDKGSEKERQKGLLQQALAG